MKHHTKTMQELDESLKEANNIRHKRTKDLEIIKAETDRMKVLIEKINKEYGIERDRD